MLSYLFPEKEPTPVDDLIETVLAAMRSAGPDHQDYPELMSKLERLYTLKAQDKPKGVSRDTIVNGAVTLLSVLLMVGYEKSNVMASKATMFLPRPK